MSSERAEALKFPDLHVRWDDPDIRRDDPDIADKFRSFFLCSYRAQLAKEREAALNTPSTTAENDDGELLFHLGLDNLPEEHLESGQFKFLLNAWTDIYHWIGSPKPETDDPSVAGLIFTRYCILNVTLMFVKHLLFFLMLDSRFHPERKIRAKAVGMFVFDECVEARWRRCLNAITTLAAGCNLLFPHAGINAKFADAVRLLHLVGDVFFNTLQSVFPIKAVCKCHKAFTLLMMDFGASRACDHIENYIRRRKTLYREIVAYEEKGGLDGWNAAKRDAAAQVAYPPELAEAFAQTIAKLDACTAAVSENAKAITDNTKVVANMDRRQRTLQTFMKTTVSGFVQQFSPGQSSPTRENVGEALLPDDRFSCLKNIKEPHASQLRAVIQMTKDHPITRSEGKKCVFTLASAALAVWERDHERWEKTPGSFETYEQLKAACYRLAEDPSTNPFYYDE